jgi:hypothetical protein
MSLVPTFMTQGMIISLKQARTFSTIRYDIPVFRLVMLLDRRRQSALVRASTWASAVAQLTICRDERFRITELRNELTKFVQTLLSFLRK